MLSLDDILERYKQETMVFRLFVHYCRQRCSLLWTSALRPCSGPVC